MPLPKKLFLYNLLVWFEILGKFILGVILRFGAMAVFWDEEDEFPLV